ncbi:hypothetical protein MTQ89_05950 [Staphylococcus hyicus]|uniref:hypothetical protein n=1 Tax=Staphylococcus hyicus TaxID=1284 RepID=UPI00208E83C0|nr:hypothetical protein [Staphylococcus hyicus]MCO4328052.1 hypothetical protein [Staphylococcus hyicus]MCO4336331.1 hypothetical protein [Staphylococcus hyicus]
MSEIIPFPKRKEIIERNIITNFDQENFEKVYDLFTDYEEAFELTSQLARLKCETLWALQSYLELKEEANILLSQGFQPYDTFMIYYVKSLFELKQYHAVIEVINQVIDEVNEHQTRLVFLPIKDQATAELNKRKDYLQHQLQKFFSLTTGEQTKLVLDLIDNHVYQYADTLAFYLNHESMDQRLITLILEYLTFAHYNQNVHIEKFGLCTDVQPNALKGVSHSSFKNKLMPQVIDWLEKDMPSLVSEAYVHLNTHNIALYPFEITTIDTFERWVSAYQIYFHSLTGQTLNKDEDLHDLVGFIKLLNT